MGFKVIKSISGVPGEKCVNIPLAGDFIINKEKEEIKMTVVPAYFMPDEYNKKEDEEGIVNKEVLKNSGTNLEIVISGDLFHKWMNDIYGETKKHFKEPIDC